MAPPSPATSLLRRRLLQTLPLWGTGLARAQSQPLLDEGDD